MEHTEQPEAININGELFDVVKPTRLLPGMVLKSKTRDVYARLGPKASALEEQIHTVSLQERGFPVAKVLESGEYSDGQWYFIEESLGKETFHAQFASEYQQTGMVSDETFTRYAAVMQDYINAQFTERNRSHITAKEFIENAIPDNLIIGNYALCGKNVERYQEAIAAATARLADTPMGVLQYDLNPFNILNRGMIDFELVGYGPLGYDTLLVSLWHRWFTSDPASRYTIAYYLSEAQITTIANMVNAAALDAGIPRPRQYMQEFLLIKSAWGFTSTQDVYDNPEEKQAFYRYRATILEHCVDSYLKGESIDPLTFPEVRA